MTKAELIARIKEELDEAGGEEITRRQIDATLEALGLAAEALLTGGVKVPLPGIGALKPVWKTPRTARNPRTGEPVKVPGRLGVKLLLSKGLKAVLRDDV